MGKKILVVRQGDRIITCLAGEKELLRIQVDMAGENKILGNIYLGKVKNIVKNINAAFVEIADKQMCYLPLNAHETPIFSNAAPEHEIRVDDELIVQVVREATKTKAPMVTANINLTGKYLVLVHGRSVLGVSAKIKNETLRKDLKNLIKPYITDSYGFIVRTNADNVSLDVIEKELVRLKNDYLSLLQYGIHWNCFSRLYAMPPSYIWEIRDGYAGEIDEIKTDDREIYEQIREYLSSVQDEDIKKLSFYEDESLTLAKLYGIESKLEKALKERVWLDSGAYLVIQPTEALTVIDVNTGKAISGKQNTEETFYKVNCEAAEEIAAQIKLRNLSGIIIVDFINMKDEPHRKMLMKKLGKLLEEDSIPTKLVGMTELNLVEITRKKVRRPLYEQYYGIRNKDEAEPEK